MPTPQQQAIVSAQNLQALAAQVIHITNAADAWLKDYNQNLWDTYWNALPTAPINADGTISATLDTDPVAGHPIAVPSQAPLLISRTQLVNAQAAMAALQSILQTENQQVTTPAQAIVKTLALLAPNTLT